MLESRRRKKAGIHQKNQRSRDKETSNRCRTPDRTQEKKIIRIRGLVREKQNFTSKFIIKYVKN